jgi:quinol monooxygenase YgiN
MIVLLELKVRPDSVDRLKDRLAEWLPATRSYDGCHGTTAHAQTEDPHVVIMIEHWESEAHYDRYRQWRSDTGVRADLVSMLESPPLVRFFQQIDA